MYILGQNFIWNQSSDFNIVFVGSVLTNDSGLGNNYDVISGDDCAVEGSLCGTIGGQGVPKGRILRTVTVELQATDLMWALMKQYKKRFHNISNNI